MIGFPFDSLVTYDEQGNPSYDRAVSSKPLKSLISKLFTTGVMPNPSDNFQVFAGTEGMTVVVHAGFAVIDGGLKLENDNRTLEIQASDTTYDRIDTVVLRWNGNDNARICDLYVLEGTPASTPVRPELTRAGSIYEIGLADIIIPRNTGAISQQRITDTRYDTDRCGIVSSVSEFDTTTLYAQIQADLDEFKDVEEADFIAWYNSIKDRIDNITAERLQSQIDDLDSEKADQILVAPVELTTTASRAYAVGEQFILNGLLYKATSAISSNDTITVGTNCDLADSVTEQINNLQDDIDDKIDTSAIANNVTTSSSGYVLDARQGKALNDLIETRTTYSTSTHIVGKWTDGKNVYETTFVLNSAETANAQSWKQISARMPSSFTAFTDGAKVMNADYSQTYVLPVSSNSRYVQLFNVRGDAAISIKIVTVQYIAT